MSNNNSGNNSLSDSGGNDLAPQYALRVALQTMKERCIILQERLQSIEEENAILRIQTSIPSNAQNSDLKISNGNGTENLHKQIKELTQQKLQLTDHITMIANENRQLWSRLSQLVKNDKLQLPQERTTTKAQVISNHTTTGGTGQNLIRSRTFTQNAPNPLLRQKHLAAIAIGMESGMGNAVNDKSLDDLSLEEISLKDVTDNEDDEIDKINRNERFENTLNYGAKGAASGLVFGYLNDYPSDDNEAGVNNDDGTITGDNDLEVETKKCIDTMLDIKKEVLEQQNELTNILNALKERKAFVEQECVECKVRNANKPEMADKIIETKDDLFGDSLKTITTNSNYHQLSCNNKSKTINNIDGIGIGNFSASSSGGNDNIENNHLNILEMKRNADRMDKICPMCGKIFNELISFNDFEEHVETHFIDDDLDPNTFERNFELVSHAVGDF